MMIKWLGMIPLLWLASFVHSAEVSVSGFADGAKHFRDGTGKESYERYATTQVREIADNILRFQRGNGGWPSNWDPQRILSEEEQKELEAAREKLDSTLDNRATYTQITYLAEAHRQTQDARYSDAALRGIAFLLEAQHPCGGFPHSYPNKANYRPYITFMDDVTAGALGMLRDAVADTATYSFVDGPLRARMADAVTRGTACILRLQQPWQGVPAVWAGQYNPDTIEPTSARMFEQPGFVCAESVNVVKYLMEIEAPSPEVIAAIEGAVKWFELSKIAGLRLEVFKIAPVRFDNHTCTRDVRVVEDPAAPPLWARFYEFDTNRPFMANRDGKKVYALSEVSLERRSGYNWYGTYPAQLLKKDYPSWRQRHAALLEPTQATAPSSP